MTSKKLKKLLLLPFCPAVFFYRIFLLWQLLLIQQTG